AFRQFQHRNFLRVAEVDWARNIGLDKAYQAFHQIVDIANRSRLAAVTSHRQRFAAQRLPNKSGYGTAIIWPHSRAVTIEDPSNPGVRPKPIAVTGRQGFGKPLPLVIHTAWSDGVDIAPIAFRLWVDLRIAVYLGCGCQDEASSFFARQFEAVERARRAGLERLDW